MQYIDLVFMLEADRMQNLVCLDKIVSKEKQVVLAERARNISSDPVALAQEEARSTLFLQNNYKRPIIGYREEIETLTNYDVLAFYRNWYSPSNAIVVIEGDISFDEAYKMADKYYGKIKESEVPTHYDYKDPQNVKTSSHILLEDKRVKQDTSFILIKADSYLTNKDNAYALQILSELLNGSVGMLYKDIVINKKIAKTINVSYSPLYKNNTAFYISYIPDDESPCVIEDAVLDILNKVAQNGVDLSELQSAKERLISDRKFLDDKFGATADLIGQYLSVGLKIEDFNSWEENLKNVTQSDLKKAVQNLLKQRLVVVNLVSNQ